MHHLSSSQLLFHHVQHFPKGASGEWLPSSSSRTFRTASRSTIQPYYKPLLIRYMSILIQPEKDIAVVLGGDFNVSDKKTSASPFILFQ